MWNDILVKNLRYRNGKCLGQHVCHVVSHHLSGYH